MKLNRSHAKIISLTSTAGLHTGIKRFKVISIARATREHKRETFASGVVKVIASHVICFGFATTYFGRQ